MNTELNIDQIFDNERRAMADEYNKIKEKRKWIIRCFYLLFWLVFFGFSLEFYLYESLTWLRSQELKLVIYIIIFSLVLFVIRSIFEFYFFYKLGRKYELINQEPEDWIKDKLKSYLLNFFFIYIFSRFFLFVIEFYSEYWWIIMGIVGSLFYIFLTFILPNVLLPLFYELKKYPEGQLRDHLLNFIKKTGLEIDEIYQINLSTKINYANAAVIGLGKTRKIIIGDNVEDKYSIEEIKAILAHELAHHIHGDIIKNLIIQSISLFFSSYIVYQIWPLLMHWLDYNMTGIYTLPYLFLIWGFIYFMLRPFQLYYSRFFENRADDYALDLIDNPESFGKALAILADESLSELKYNNIKKLFEASHPSFIKRIKKAFAR